MDWLLDLILTKVEQEYHKWSGLSNFEYETGHYKGYTTIFFSCVIEFALLSILPRERTRSNL